jgi:hypothetical protein
MISFNSLVVVGIFNDVTGEMKFCNPYNWFLYYKDNIIHMYSIIWWSQDKRKFENPLPDHDANWITESTSWHQLSYTTHFIAPIKLQNPTPGPDIVWITEPTSLHQLNCKTKSLTPIKQQNTIHETNYTMPNVMIPIKPWKQLHDINQTINPLLTPIKLHNPLLTPIKLHNPLLTPIKL